ncbi:hypothetical protein BGZ60DRAFT_420841 [Tricladium varicosporioides]|nr:hypothetical protein BGZ60DRAFT_420841 [Hymenoscyphus varicosporioides]
MRIADIIPRVGRRPGRAAAKAEALQDAIRGEAEADEVLNGLFPGVQPANAQNAFNDYMAMHNAPQDLRDQIDYPVPLQLPKLGEPGPPVANPNNGNPLPNLGQLNVQLEIPALRPDPMDLFQGPPQLGAQRINRTRNPVAVARGDQVNEARGDALEIETQAALQSNTPPDALRQLDAVMADLAALPQRRLSLHKPVAQKLEGYYDKNREGSSAAALGQKKEDSRRKRKESDKIAREMGARAHDAGRLDVFENPPGFIYGSLGNASVLPRRRAARPHEDVRRNIVRRLENVTITPQANRNAQPDAPEVAPGQIPQLCHSVKALDILPTSPQEERDALKAFVELMMRADGRDKGLKLIDFGLMLQHVYDSILDENEERIQTAASAALNPSVEREYLAREQHQARMDALLILRQQDAARLQIAPVQSAGDLLKNGNQDFEKKMKELRERTAAWNNAAAAAGNSERGGDPMKGIEGPRMPTQDIGSPLPLPTIARKGMQGKLEPNPPSAQPVRASRTPNAPAVLPALSPNPVQANLQAQRTFLEDQLARTSDGPLAQNIRQNLVAINELLTTRDQAQQRRREAVLQAPPALRFAPIRPGRHHATLQQKQAESGRIDELDKKPAAMQGWQRQPRPRNHQIVPLVHEAPAPRQVPTNRRKTDKVNKTLLDYRNEQLHLMGQAQAALRNGSRGADVKLGGFLPRIGSALPIAQAQASASAPNTIPVQQHSAARSLQDMADEPMEDPNNIVDREDGILGWKNERAKK